MVYFSTRPVAYVSQQTKGWLFLSLSRTGTLWTIPCQHYISQSVPQHMYHSRDGSFSPCPVPRRYGRSLANTIFLNPSRCICITAGDGSVSPCPVPGRYGRSLANTIFLNLSRRIFVTVTQTCWDPTRTKQFNFLLSRCVFGGKC
jgi:hypothetical protein